MDFWQRWDNIIYFWTNGILKTLPESFTDNISPKNPLKKVKLALKHLGADFLRTFKKEDIPKKKIWFLVLTKNNYDALKDVQSKTKNSIFTSFFRFRSTINEETYYFYLNRKFLWDLIFPINWALYALKRPIKAARYFDLLVAVNGSYHEHKRMLKKNGPKAIVFTNDHLVEARSMLLAANSMGIPTFYIPHASVSASFPPLEFNYALLDGQDTLEKYKKCGPVSSEVELMGMPKFDRYVCDVNTSNSIRSIGIAFNMVDRLEDVLGLAKNIQGSFKEMAIILRPHPGDKRPMGSVPKGISISDSKQVDAFTFLNQIDVLISGESSIHLEAVLLNVYPLYFTFTPNNRFDFYGFIDSGLVENFNTIDGLTDKIHELRYNKPDVSLRANYYNAAVGTELYGKTCVAMSKYIEEKTR